MAGSGTDNNGTKWLRREIILVLIALGGSVTTGIGASYVTTYARVKIIDDKLITVDRAISEAKQERIAAVAERKQLAEKTAALDKTLAEISTDVRWIKRLLEKRLK